MKTLKNSEDLEKLCGLEICYTNDPNKTMLQIKLKVNGVPHYHRYKDDLPKSTNLQEQIILSTVIKKSVLLYINLTTLLDNQRQLIQYPNKVQSNLDLRSLDITETSI